MRIAIAAQPTVSVVLVLAVSNAPMDGSVPVVMFVLCNKKRQIWLISLVWLKPVTPVKGSANYNPLADFNKNNCVTITDQSFLQKYYGKAIADVPQRR